MTELVNLSDSLQNLVAGLGTERDKAAHSSYALVPLTDIELIAAFKSSWVARKGVSTPAVDSCRKWRAWQASASQISAIEAEEARLGLKAKIMEARIKARLFGGAAVLIGTGDKDVSVALDPKRVAKGGIKYLTVMTRRQLVATERENDPTIESYGQPKAYRLPGSTVDIHPSRLVKFIGAHSPDDDLLSGANFGWGDSVLSAAMPAVKHYDETVANVVSLVYEAKVDVINIPNLMASMGNPGYEAELLKRLRLAAMAKGINGTLILDGTEVYSSKSTSFSGLTDIIAKVEQGAAGAFDIPITRMFAQTVTGLSASGDENTRNYYDNIQSQQDLELRPAMAILDECLIRSALGSRPKQVYYAWSPLWQPTASEQATIGKTTADTVKVLSETKLFNPDALSKAAVNMLTELSVMPGLEAAIDEFGSDLPEEEIEPKDPAGRIITDAAPRSLYVSRNVLNAEEIIAWAKDQGFPSTLAAEDMHVTIAYSRDPVDWMKVGDSWSGDSKGQLNIAPGGPRLIEVFGGGAVVLQFSSSELGWRHMSIREAGASWDWPDYQPHITITYEAGDVDLSKIEPYRGAIDLGPEIFAEVKDSWQSSITEETA